MKKPTLLSGFYFDLCLLLQQSNNLSDITLFANDLAKFSNHLIKCAESFDIKEFKLSLNQFVSQVEQ